MVEFCGCEKLETALNQGEMILDVREPSEYASEHIKGSTHVPLGKLKDRNWTEGQVVYCVCRSGERAAKAAEWLSQKGVKVVVLEGGVKAWAAKGKALQVGERRIWSLDRQVRFAAGAFALAGFALAYWVDVRLIAIPIFVGFGLVFSGVTDLCPMALLLAKMPWNQKKATPPAKNCCMGA